jgi:hypothetical protein
VALEIWIPPTAREPKRRVLRCEVCLRRGILKEFPFDQRQQWRRHVIACAKKHEDVVDGEVAEATKSAFRSQADPELFAHMRRKAARGEKPSKPLHAA